MLNASRRISFRRFYPLPTLYNKTTNCRFNTFSSTQRKEKKNNKEGKHEYKLQGQNSKDENRCIRYTGETWYFIIKYFLGLFLSNHTNIYIYIKRKNIKYIINIYIYFFFFFPYIESRFVQREIGKRDKILINIDDAAKVDSRRWASHSPVFSINKSKGMRTVIPLIKLAKEDNEIKILTSLTRARMRRR